MAARGGGDDNRLDTKESNLRLEVEAQSPFRLTRKFFVGALGANAALGTLITLARLVRDCSL